MRAFMRLVASLAVSLLALTAPNKASATIIDITYTGQVFGGTANASTGTYCGLCSASGYDYTGQAFGLTYTFDTAQGAYSNNGLQSSLSGSYNLLIGGSFPGYVGGVISILPSECSGVPGCFTSASDSASIGATYTQMISLTAQQFETLYVTTSLFPNLAIPGDITSSFSLSGPDIGSGSFSVGMSPGAACGQPADWQCPNGNLQIETVRVTVSTTPLPATLPLFVAGLGVLTLLGWRRGAARSIGRLNKG